MRSLGRSLAVLGACCIAGQVLAGIPAMTAIEDLAVDFGPGGLWARANNTDWIQLATHDVEGMATGDLDGSGRSELIVDLGPLGLWVFYDAETWVQLHALDVEHIAAGNLNGNVTEDLVVDFGPVFGLWTWTDNKTWSAFHPASPETFTLGDIALGSNDALAVDFGDAFGLWIYESGNWLQLSPRSPENFTLVEAASPLAAAPPTDVIEPGREPAAPVVPAGGLPCNGCGVYADYGIDGLWYGYPFEPPFWTRVHPLDTQTLGTGDFDGDGNEDLVVAFTGSGGTWLLSAVHGFVSIHALPVQVEDTALMDGGNLSEGVFGFGPGIGLWVLRNALTWSSLHPITPDQVVSGDFDGELVQTPIAGIVKSVNPRGIVGEGGDAEFTIEITNEGNEPFTINAVGDTAFDLESVCPELLGAVLGFGGLAECTFTEPIEGAPGSPHVNTAIVEVLGQNSGRTSGVSDTASVVFTDSVIASFTPEGCPSAPAVRMVAGPSSESFFSIDIMVDQIEDFFGVAFHLMFDPTSAVFISSSFDESILTETGADTAILAGEIAPGEIAAVATLLGRGYCSNTGQACNTDENCTGGGTCLPSIDNATGAVMRLQFQATAIVTAGDPIMFTLGHRQVTECTSTSLPCTDVAGEVTWCGGTLFAIP